MIDNMVKMIIIDGLLLLRLLVVKIGILCADSNVQDGCVLIMIGVRTLLAV